MAQHTIYTRVDDDVHRELKRIADTDDRAISYVVARILRTSLPNTKAAKEKAK